MSQIKTILILLVASVSVCFGADVVQILASLSAADRAEVIAGLKREYAAEVARIEKEERARAEPQIAAKQAEYACTRGFSACYRHIPGAEYDIRQMRRELKLVPGYQQKLAGLQQEIVPYARDLVALGAAYRTAVIALRRAGAQSSRIGSPLYNERRAIVRKLERQISLTQERIAMIQRRMVCYSGRGSGMGPLPVSVPLQQEIQRIQGEAATWEWQEQRLRAQEAAEIAQLTEARAAAIQAGIANLWSTPKYAFIYRYMRQEEGIRAKQKEIEAKEQLMSMLKNANVGPEVIERNVNEVVALRGEKTELEEELKAHEDRFFADSAVSARDLAVKALTTTAKPKEE
ncbi:MAG: hypothetical protein KAX19_12905 [Candidatus Brocadiae bacterium]|nr:hypothetical protein [Candidatus Brocadiia bacterium]